MQIVVDNTAGGDVPFADEVARGLGERGFEVESRRPNPRAKFDTSVNLLKAGLVIRVSERPDRVALDDIRVVVRAALQHRASLRRRTRSVPIHLGETPRVLEWVDVFD
jgi:hypothetical protein